MTKLAFRDLDNRSNIENGKSYHAAGIIVNITPQTTTSSENNTLVKYINPFDGLIETAWRTYTEIEVFNIPELEYDLLCKRYDGIDKL